MAALRIFMLHLVCAELMSTPQQVSAERPPQAASQPGEDTSKIKVAEPEAGSQHHEAMNNADEIAVGTQTGASTGEDRSKIIAELKARMQELFHNHSEARDTAGSYSSLVDLAAIESDVGKAPEELFHNHSVANPEMEGGYSSLMELAALEFDVDMVPQKELSASELPGQWKNLQSLKLLGVGAFGIVYGGKANNGCKNDLLGTKCRYGSTDVAVKKIKMRGRGSRYDVLFGREIAGLIEFKDNPYFVRYYSYDKGSEGLYYIFMETVNGGDFESFMDKRMSPTENVLRQHYEGSLEDKMRLFADLFQGLAAMHKRKILHRDIKLGNVLMTQDCSGARSETPCRGKIADLGLACCLSDSTAAACQEKCNLPNCAKLPACSASKTGKPTGTPNYLPPEMGRKGNEDWEKVGAKGDMWAMGLTLYAVLFGELPTSVTDGPDSKKLPRGVTKSRGWNIWHDENLGVWPRRREKPSSSNQEEFSWTWTDRNRTPVRWAASGRPLRPDNREEMWLVASLLDEDPDERPTAEEAYRFIKNKWNIDPSPPKSSTLPRCFYDGRKCKDARDKGSNRLNPKELAKRKKDCYGQAYAVDDTVEYYRTPNAKGVPAKVTAINGRTSTFDLESKKTEGRIKKGVSAASLCEEGA